MSLRHTRLLRIANMLARGDRPYNQRAIFWKGKTYLLADLERERINGGEHPNWDRIWRPQRMDAKQNHRWRNSVGRRLRRLYFAPLARGVTTFYSDLQLNRMLVLVTAPDNLIGRTQSLTEPRRKLTFEEFKRVWVR